MKKLIFVSTLIVTMLLSGKAYQQSSPDSNLVNKLYYTCKVWGYEKYFHSSMSDCSIRWDSVLVNTLPDIINSTSWQEFNEILLDMAMAPGEMAIPSGPPPMVPDSLKLNLHLGWFNDTAIYDPVKTVLDTIKSRFRLQNNCYVYNGYVGNPNFSLDTAYNRPGNYPSLEVRLLGLFRYWNDIEYFFPYTDIMDKEWDSVLIEMIPWFYEAHTGLEYALAVTRIAHNINDTHAYTGSDLVNQYFGYHYPRFFPLEAEGQMVVAFVDESVTEIAPGDIILEMDGAEIEPYKESFLPFIPASNESRMQYNLDNTLCRSPNSGDFNMVVKNENGIKEVTLDRSWDGYSYFGLIANTGPVWYDTILPGGCNYGYVDMGRLQAGNEDEMFEDLWETDAIVFDIRNYPNGTLWTIVDYLYPTSLHIANFTEPRVAYPGTIRWEEEYIGMPQPELYQGSIIILFNEMTLSQAEYTCMGLDAHPKSIKIGSQTAGADGNVSKMFLPGEVYTYMTGLGTFYPDYTPTQRIGIVPDYEVRPTVQGLREERDEVLEFAMVCGFVGLEDKQSKETYRSKVYPNPSSGSITIEKGLPGTCSIEIFDNNGKKIKAITVTKEAIQLNMKGLNDGLYLILISNGSEVQIERIIVD